MKTVLVSLCALALLSLSSCNTWIGFTRDLQMAGKNMEENATEVTTGPPEQPAYDYNQPQYQGY